ncbi:TonB-dependent receptor [Pollutibacter soli]|uniref:TonB-dependent receptor n=1 Tax=Pollutibacter soli TaxID=3034157 RepID=UPI0030140B01
MVIKISLWILLVFCFPSMTFSAHSQEKPGIKDSVVELSQIVVSASRSGEKLLQAPVSIEKLSPRDIRQTAQPSFFDAIENLKGIHMITPSLGFKVINARGFSNTTNVRFVQMVDGMDIQAPHIGAPMANSLGPSDLDIQSVEVLPGAASALYGMNAINGTANFLLNDPFNTEGLSIYQKTGVNHINSSEHSAALNSETSLRWAKVLGSNWAFKINTSYTAGVDWYADNRMDLAPNLNASTGLTGELNPGKDLVNIYGDEASNRRTLTLGGKQYIVSRSGYAEKDMASYDLGNFKGDVSLAFRPSEKMYINYTFRFAHTNTIYQRTNRFRLDRYATGQHSISLKTGSIQFRAYVNTENTGDSYNIRSMAENVDRGFKSDNNWFSDFTNSYNNAISQGSDVSDAMNIARSYADNDRPAPHTPEMDSLIDKLRDINNWDQGAALRVKAQMYHAEIQHTITNDIFKKLQSVHKLSIMYGLDYREYAVVPDGNYFINPSKPGSNLHYRKAGGFIQATQQLFKQKLKLNAVLRIDKNQYYEAKLNPRFAVVYSPSQQHNFRIAFQQGDRFPSLFEAFSNINSGGVKRVGGLPVMSNGIFENSYLRSSIDAFQAANTKDINSGGLTLDEAVQKNQGLLKKNEYTYLEPEKIQSIEFGYRGVVFDNKIVIDLDLYYNVYKNLMAQVEANIPNSTAPDSLLYILNNRQRQARYRLWTNSKTVSYNYGSTLGLTWNFFKNYTLAGNVTLAKLDRKTNNDGLEDAFNTPMWIYNVAVGNPDLWSGVGFQINFRWQSECLWQSSLATGEVKAYSSMDGQVQYHPKKDNWSVKIGGVNLLNRYYYSYIGGPSLGGIYYCTFVCKVI